MITVCNLHKTYDKGSFTVNALRDINFSVRAGEFVSIMGASGSGKSTLMNVLGLLDTPSSGSYLLEEQEVSSLTPKEQARWRNRKIGFVFQSFNLLPRLSALQNVELPMLYAGVSPKERRKKAIRALERMGLKERLNHRPSELSGGQNQRVAIARALVNDPAIILADEPTGALDSRTSLEIMHIFQQLNQAGATIVLITHEEDIGHHAGRILRLRDGTLISDETVEYPLTAKE